MPKPLLIVIGGPTGVGKTDLALQLAQYFSTEILSADSRQCYKELNIGVAKPTDEELRTIKHHFINSHSIFDTVNAGVYEKYGLAVLKDLFQKYNIVILVGGTGLYIDALLYGIDEIPTIPTEIRQMILKQYHQYGMSWLQQELAEKDSELHKIIDIHNPHRIMRALEVVTHTGKSITSYRKKQLTIRPFDTLKLVVTRNRDELYRRINARVDNMMHDGLLQETKTLSPYKNFNALHTVGYREIFSYLNGERTLEDAIAEIKKNTRRYAKRQITWFSRDASYQAIYAEKTTNQLEQALTLYKSFSK